jgi:DNA-binding transcriptional ArsR family regulator
MTTKSPIAAALEQFELERTNLLARLAKLDNLIAQTRDVFHLPNGNGRKANEPAPKPARAPKASGNGHGDLSADAIRAALKNGPLSPGKLVEQLGVERARLRYQLVKLEEQGVVISTGSTANRRVALAPHRTAKEAP